MICYKDMTFCSSSCGNTKCHRFLSEQVVLDAQKWWGSNKAPIAVSDFNHNGKCPDWVRNSDA